MTENKKEWVTPELIVLVRSKPEEAVLTGCKWHDDGGIEHGYIACKYVTSCEGCYVLSGS